MGEMMILDGENDYYYRQEWTMFSIKKRSLIV